MARAAPNLPVANAQAREDAAAFLKHVAGIDVVKCPHCQHGRWLTIQILPPLRNTAATAACARDRTTQCRGPP